MTKVTYKDAEKLRFQRTGMTVIQRFDSLREHKIGQIQRLSTYL